MKEKCEPSSDIMEGTSREKVTDSALVPPKQTVHNMAVLRAPASGDGLTKSVHTFPLDLRQFHCMTKAAGTRYVVLPLAFTLNTLSAIAVCTPYGT